MTSVVEIEIAAPRPRVADLFSDPANNPKWMSDIERCEPVTGTLGMPGSRYGLVPKSGDRVFVATVVSKDLPDELRLRLEALLRGAGGSVFWLLWLPASAGS